MPFSDARSRVPDPDVTLLAPTRRAPDIATSQAIRNFGDFAGQLNLGRLLGKQRERLARFADEVAVIQDEGAFIERDAQGNVVDVDLTFVEGAEAVDLYGERMRRLATDTKQGRISDTRLQIESEAILRQAIAAAPGFAPEFRAQARELLGFDPSGAAIRAIMGLGEEEQVEVNPLVEQAMNISEASGGAISLETALSTVVSSTVAELQAKVTQEQFRQGSIEVNTAALDYADLAAVRAAGVLNRVLNRVEQTGDIGDSEEFVLELQQIRNNVLAEFRRDATERPVRREEIKAGEDLIIGEFQPIIDFVGEKDQHKVVLQNRDVVAALYETYAARFLPGLTIMRQFGEGWMNFYIEMLSVARGDARALAELARENPKIAIMRAVDAKAEDIAAAINSIVTGTAPTIDIDPNTINFIIESALVNEDPDVRDAGVNAKLDQGQVNQGLSAAAQAINSFDQASDQTKAGVKNAFGVNQGRVQEELVDSLTGTGLKLGFRDGLFTVISQDDREIFPEDLDRYSQPQRGPVRTGRRGARGVTVSPGDRTDFGLFEGRFGEEVPRAGNRREARARRSLLQSIRPTIDKLNQAQWALVRKPEWPEFLLQEQGLDRGSYILTTLSQVNSQLAREEALLQTSPSLGTEQLDKISDLIEMGSARVREGRVNVNEDGSISSLRSASVQDERLNSGAITLIPTIDEKGNQMTIEQATESAVNSNRSFPIFATEEEATAVSNFISREILNATIQENAPDAGPDGSVPAQSGDIFLDPQSGKIIRIP